MFFGTGRGKGKAKLWEYFQQPVLSQLGLDTSALLDLHLSCWINIEGDRYMDIYR